MIMKRIRLPVKAASPKPLGAAVTLAGVPFSLSQGRLRQTELTTGNPDGGEAIGGEARLNITADRRYAAPIALADIRRTPTRRRT